MSTDTTTPPDARGLLAQACAELSRRRADGDDAHVEDLLVEFPALAERDTCLRELLLAEMAGRQLRGEALDLEEWTGRFPRFADELRRLLATPTALPVRDDEALTVPAVAPGARPAVGKVFGSYDLEDEVGRGGMGVVFRARHRTLGHTVALKTLRHVDLASPEEYARFLHEARAVARLRHPNVVPLLDFGQVDGCPYYTMPLLQGGNLEVHRSRLLGDVRAAAALVEKLARGLHHAHEHGVIHRDLKPRNVLLSDAGEPLAADFGVAKLVDATRELTAPGQALGTAAYMAPEVARGAAATADARSDVWSLGVVLYELLTGRRPFQAPRPAGLPDVILTTEPTPPREVRPDLCPGLEAVVLTCLQKEPARRYATAAALADDLKRWDAGEPLSVRPAGPLTRLRRGIRRRPVLAALVGSALATAVGGPAWLLGRGEARIRRRVRADLESTGRTVLIPAVGPPAWWRWLGGRGRVRGEGEFGGIFSLGTDDFALVQLLPEVPLPRYRLRVQTHLAIAASLLSEVGLAFFQGSEGWGGDAAHGFALLRYSDVQPLRPADPKGLSEMCQASLRLRRCRQDNEDFDSQPLAWLPFKHQGVGWRDLEVEVQPDAIRCRFGTQNVGGAVGPDAFARAVAPLARRGPPVSACLDRRGGVGVYVRLASASFRNLILEPLEV